MNKKLLWLTALVLVMSMLAATAMADMYDSSKTATFEGLKVGDILAPGVVVEDTPSLGYTRFINYHDENGEWLGQHMYSNSASSLVIGSISEAAGNYVWIVTMPYTNDVEGCLNIRLKRHSHTVVEHEGTPATCSAMGTSDYYSCSCGLFSLNSDLSNPVTSLTALQALNGYEIGLDENNHDWAEEFYFDGGKHWHPCKNEVKSGAEVLTHKNDLKDHEWKEVVDKEPTTSAAGLHHDECKICGYKTQATEIPALPVLPSLPETGDNSQLMLWTSLMVMAVAALFGSKKFASKTR